MDHIPCSKYLVMYISPEGNLSSTSLLYHKQKCNVLTAMHGHLKSQDAFCKRGICPGIILFFLTVAHCVLHCLTDFLYFTGAVYIEV